MRAKVGAVAPDPLKPDSLVAEFAQDVDTNGAQDDICNTLKISTEFPGYLVIETARWALDADDIDRFAATLRWMLSNAKGDKE